MEANGIGTDASIPTHINNIVERNYVQIQVCYHKYPPSISPELSKLLSTPSYVKGLAEKTTKGDANFQLYTFLTHSC